MTNVLNKTEIRLHSVAMDNCSSSAFNKSVPIVLAVPTDGTGKCLYPGETGPLHKVDRGKSHPKEKGDTIVHEWNLRHGALLMVNSDHREAFTAALHVTPAGVLLRINRKYSTAYRPRANGVV